jgi:hypothetical protein
MYLSELNITEKRNFLELAHYAMGVNGAHKESEQEILEAFYAECNIGEYELSQQDQISLVIEQLAKTEEQIKKIIILEIFGVLLADGEYCDAEKNFMASLAESLEVDNYLLKKIKRWVQAMNDLVGEGYSMILGS